MANQKFGKLIMMVGIPGSGKSTWINENKDKYDAVISRDRIRFSLLKEGEDYFAREDDVFKLFIWEINMSLFNRRNGGTVFADATHLNKKARAKVLNAITKHIQPDEIECVWLDTELDTAIERNEQREGRARVPRGVIRRMYFSMEEPRLEEGFNKITIIREDEE